MEPIKINIEVNLGEATLAALGRLLTGGVMIGSMLKEDKALVTLQIRGDGPAGGLTVTADSHFHRPAHFLSVKPALSNIRKERSDCLSSWQ